MCVLHVTAPSRNIIKEYPRLCPRKGPKHVRNRLQGHLPPSIKCTTIIECTIRYTVNKLLVQVSLKLDLCSEEHGSNLER
jgi:hypothetical protein